jgi:hypothetical protein
MSDLAPPVGPAANPGNDELQFDRVVTGPTASPAPNRIAVVCAACHASIATEYYTVNGITLCGRCRHAIESAAETPQGLTPFLVAGVFGLGAGIAGAVIYYAVIAIAHIEVGIVAILIGYMVGYAVRKGARGRGGLRLQVLAVALTYASVALAYTPLAIRGASESNRRAQKAAVSTSERPATVAPGSSRAATTTASGRRLLLRPGLVVVLFAALPLMVVAGSFPSGLISAVIIFLGMRQAWRMTGAPRLEVFGPYRVGAVPSPAHA